MGAIFRKQKNDWHDIKYGFVIQMADGRFVSEILANGHPENPLIYFTEYAWEAKSWKTSKSALKAADRVREKAGECCVRGFVFDEERQARILRGYVEANQDEEEGA
ncbi:MAG: hypothetical protein IKE81_06405 [Clostridia bacterium]|nr:hypothetical protein [Clostridia bacterium]